MAYLITSDGKFRDFTHDEAYRSYLITRTDSPSDYRFGRGHGGRVAARARSALRRVNGYLKNMIEAVADSKLHRMERELELSGVRDRANDKRVTRNPGRAGVRED
jgi:hypothetical protein